MRTRRIVGLVALFIAACGGDDDAVTPRPRDGGTAKGGTGGKAGDGGPAGTTGKGGTTGTGGAGGGGGTTGKGGSGGTVGVDGGDAGDAYVTDGAVDAGYMDARADGG